MLLLLFLLPMSVPACSGRSQGSDSQELDDDDNNNDDNDADTDSDSDEVDSETGSDIDTDVDTDIDTDTDTSDNGLLLWVKQAGGPAFDSANDHCVRADGFSFVTGAFVDEAVFGPGESNETILVSDGEEDIFIAKYNFAGELKWVKRAGGVQTDSGLGVTALDDGGAAVSGEFRDQVVFAPGEAEEICLTTNGYRDLFVAKYEGDGTLAWVKQAGGENHDMGHRIVSLPDGAVLVAGEFTKSAVFGKGEDNETTLTSYKDSKYEDIFLAKYDPNGELVWAKQAGGMQHDYVHRAVVLDDGSFLITGQYEGLAVFGPGEENETVLKDGLQWNVFVAKYRADGSLAWARSAGGEWIDAGYGISAWPDGSFAITGSFEFAATFGPGEPNETALDATGDHRNHEIFLAKYDKKGRLRWAKPAGGRAADKGLGIMALPGGEVLVSGSFSYEATFGLGEPNQVSLQAGRCSIFFAKYRSDGAFAWVRYAPGGG